MMTMKMITKAGDHSSINSNGSSNRNKSWFRGFLTCLACASCLVTGMAIGSRLLELGGTALFWPCSPLAASFFSLCRPCLLRWLILTSIVTYVGMILLDCGKIRGNLFLNLLFLMTDMAEAAAVTLCLQIFVPSPANVIRASAIINIIMLFPLVMAPIKGALNTLLVFTCFGPLHLPLWETLATWLIGDFFVDFFIIYAVFVVRYHLPDLVNWRQKLLHCPPLRRDVMRSLFGVLVFLSIAATSFAAVLNHFRIGRQPLFYLAGRLLFPTVGMATVAFGQLGACLAILVATATSLATDFMVNDEKSTFNGSFMADLGDLFQVLVCPLLIVIITWSISYLAVALTERQDTLLLLSEKNEQLVQQEKELREAKLAAEKALSSKTEFFARVSHEFRTPLNVVLGFSEELTKSPDLNQNPETSDRIQYILAAGESLLRIVDDILELFRLTSTASRQLQVNSTSVDIHSLFNTICDLVEVISKEKGLHFLKYIDPTLPPSFYLDRVRFSQLVMNLASNACKYSRSKGGVISIRLANEGPILDRPGYMTLRLDVQDNGPGIPPEFKDRIFESFFRVGSSTGKTSKGHGLGLAITKQLVDLLEGRIVVQSSVGLGSLFSVYIPLQVTDPFDEKGGGSGGLANRPSDRPVQGLKILSVEDIMVNQIVLGGMLKQDGHSVVFVETGSAALTTIDPSFDLMLLDLQLPDMHGIDVLNVMRKHPDAKLSSMPIVVVSALALDKEKEECAAAGADGFITKPVKLNLLRKELKDLANVGRLGEGRMKAEEEEEGSDDSEEEREEEEEEQERRRSRLYGISRKKEAKMLKVVQGEVNGSKGRKTDAEQVEIDMQAHD